MFLKKAKSKNLNELIVYSPVDGKVKDITQVSDQVFSQKMVGDGLVVEPSNGIFNSPVDGEVKVAFETGHAYGIVDKKSGVELLIHIGIDTVALNGKGFKAHVKDGDKVSKGTKLADVNLKKISKKAPSTDTMVLVTLDSLKDWKIKKIAKDTVEAGEPLFKLVK